MRVGINLLYLRPSKVGGSEIYIRKLISHLEKLKEVKLTLFCSEEVARTFIVENVKIRVVSKKRFSQFNRFVNENFILKRYLGDIDLLFSPTNFAAPLLFSPVPQVVTVFDLQHLWYKEYFSLSKSAVRSIFFKAAFIRCKQIIAISEFTRIDIINKYHVLPELVTTVYCGVDRHLDIGDLEANIVLEKYGLKNGYFYYPAMLLPHKNHYFLIEVYAKFKQKTGSEIELIFTGDQNKNYPLLYKYIDDLGLSRSVRHLGYLEHKEVLALMAKAKALLFPSKFEGFGLPILEAMICGAPVVASNSTSIPEISGDAAILLDPEDLQGWSSVLEMLIEDDNLRNSLIAKGYMNIDRFSWKQCALQTLDVFKSTLGL